MNARKGELKVTLMHTPIYTLRDDYSLTSRQVKTSQAKRKKH